MEPLPAKIRQKTFDKIRANLAANPYLDLEIDYQSAVSTDDRPVLNVKCNHCGTETTRSTRCLSKTSLRCNGCMVLKYSALSESVGYLYHNQNGRYVSATCNSCGTNANILKGTLARGSIPDCEPCLRRKYGVLAENLTFKYLGRRVIKKSTLEVSLECKNGHVFASRASNLRQGKIICKECQNLSYIDALLKKNCTLVEVELVSGNKRKIHYQNSKGELFSATSSNVLNNSFAATLDGQWRDKHSTYIIRLENNGNIYCKIGTAQEPEKRLARLKLIGNAEVFTLASFDDRFGADKLESELQREFKVFKLPKEVASTFTQAIVMSKRKGQAERVPRADGSSEWFQGNEVFETLSKRYNLKE